jgi:peptidoglycan/LPS O-acetylase OafA/YrhL
LKKYYGIDWLRVGACIGILAMHVAANNDYAISGFVYQRLIPSFTDFVFLFMAISAFGMCCGYFEKVMSGKVNWTDFYRKRYGKILPFFLLLILIDLVMDFSLPSLAEGLMESTLLHGLIPNTLSVIGVGWFLGTVFAFYLMFPFYCVLIETRKRAWFAFAASLILNYLCTSYFDLGRANIIHSLCFFLAGGLVYLYRAQLEKIKWYFYLPVILLALLSFYLLGNNTLSQLFVSIALLVFAISINCKQLRPITFISNISMEIYLSHMLVLRGIELLGANRLLGNGWLQYLVCVALVLVGAGIFSFITQKLLSKTLQLLKRPKR